MPLVVLVGTANDLPSDPALEAFTDRFLLRVRVAPVAADHFDDLLAVGAGIEQQRLDLILEEQRRSRAAGAGGAAGSAGPAGSPGFGARPYRASRGDRSAGFTLDDLDQITAAVSEVDVAKVHDPYRALVHELLRQGVELSDRRIVLGLKLIRAAALLDHRLRARPADLWPLAHFWTDEGDEPLVAEAVRAVVAEDGGDPGMPGVSARMLALRAADYFRAFQAGDFSPGTVDDTLKRLSHLRRTIEDHHPSAREEREEISVLIRKVQTYYNPAGPGPGAANPSAHGSP
ncbi:MAG: hypothetical protein HOW97_18150 [Catenulispora sp.]|nr:hypothetical protein [Catenulispora sp.]